MPTNSTSYLASIEVDQRQRIISATDKLKEMLGGSWNIENTVRQVILAVANSKHTRIILPASGAIWLWSDNLADLNTVLWQCRQTIVEDSFLPCTFGIEEITADGLDQAKQRLELQIRNRKDQQSGEHGAPSSPLFANCLLQPDQFANHWLPKRQSRPQTSRRALISAASEARRKLGQETLKAYLHRFPAYQRRRPKRLKAPRQFEDLTHGFGDQFLAFIKADGDGMSAIVSSLNTTNLAAALDAARHTKLDALSTAWLRTRRRCGWPESRTLPDSIEPVDALSLFSTAVEEVQWAALIAAVERLPQLQQCAIFPAVPIVRAGEDTVLICRRDLALDLALAFGQEYAQLAANDLVLSTALQTSGAANAERLTLSFGLIFAKQSYPVEMLWELSEELLRNAKKARAEAASPQPEGWIDTFWWASSGRQDIDEARDTGFHYHDGTCHLSLTTRPWTLAQAKNLVEIAAELALGSPETPAISPGKWVMLDTALRLGKDLGALAYRRWLTRLTEGERNSLFALAARLGTLAPNDIHRSPWRENGNTFDTVWLDLAELISYKTGESGS